MVVRAAEIPIRALDVSVYRVPTETPESDGTLAWDATTLVTVTCDAGNARGIGFTYADSATARLIVEKLKPLVVGRDALDIRGCWNVMVHAIRNLGRPGICSMAIAAVDNALWDLKARLLDVPLVRLLGQVRTRVPVYGSGGFTSYSDRQLSEQLSSWVEAGIGRVKMKVGREPQRDAARAATARQAIRDAQLFVDANGAYTRKQALALAEAFADQHVSWFEEPVSSDDLDGLHLLRDRAPAGMDISAGEYGYDLVYFRRMLEAQAVDTLQADATRCAGISGFMQVAALCEAFCVPLSSHCAPSIHAHPCCAATPVCHLEWFHDHVRIESMLFDGALQPEQGALQPDLSRPGLGIDLRTADAKRYAVTA
jgi:L-alanine-DL-glutamate epimerase-like enolase superfamily enzyme